MAERQYATKLAISVIVALAGVLAIRRGLDAPKAQSRIATRPVVVAVHDVPEGQAIERANVTVAQWPTGTVPVGGYSSIDSVVGRIAFINIYKGEVIVRGRLAAPTDGRPELLARSGPASRETRR